MLRRGFVLLFLLLPYGAQAEVCYRNYFTGRNVSAVARTSQDLSEISTQFFALIKKKIPCTYNEQNLSFQKALKEFENYRLDLFAFAPINEVWLRYADPVVLYTTDRLLLINRKFYKKGLAPQDYLKNPKIRFIGIAGGHFYLNPNEVAQLEKQKRLIYDTFPDGVIERFSLGQADAAFTSPTYWNRHRQQFKLSEMSEMIRDSENQLPIALFISKKRLSEAEKTLFKKSVEELRKEGAFRKVLQKYVSDEDLNTFYHF